MLWFVAIFLLGLVSVCGFYVFVLACENIFNVLEVNLELRQHFGAPAS